MLSFGFLTRRGDYAYEAAYEGWFSGRSQKGVFAYSPSK